MFVIVGWLVALGCIFGVYIAHGGNIDVVLHALPFEMITIGGAALGAFVANNQIKVLKATAGGPGPVLQGQQVHQGALHGADGAALRHPAEGAQGRPDVDREGRRGRRTSSPLFQKYPTVGSDHHVVEFITDYLRMMVSGNLNAHEIESLMDSEIETHHHEAHARGGGASQRLAGGLPAFGIVAAVLGVVNTMGSVGQPPAVLGGMIGSALVGTFLGILLAYGFVEPLAGLLEQKVDESGKELQCIKTTLLASRCRATRRRWRSSSAARCCIRASGRPSPSSKSHVKGKK